MVLFTNPDSEAEHGSFTDNPYRDHDVLYSGSRGSKAYIRPFVYGIPDGPHRLLWHLFNQAPSF